MILFATPDFGAGACIWGLLGIVWLLVLLLVLVGFEYGAKLLGSGSRSVRRLGILLLLLCLATPLLCYFGPRQVVRLTHGNYPLDGFRNRKITQGMSRDEVLEVLGTPHERGNQADEEKWYYWLDSFGIGLFWVYFDADGRVTGAYGN
jgi:SmpA / OmlA family